ncbi:MAG: hypothetical protein EA401_06755 [Planctomycetota bacterium]|nr:MAG: hypothetical protein EA401_06755 [Planctomycetota bacterium]
MDGSLVHQGAGILVLNQFLLSLFLLIPMVLVARTVVAGTRYSPILIIVIFGLGMGFIMRETGVSSPGLSEFPLIDLVARATIVALIVSFFVGGQELRKIFGKITLPPDDTVVLNTEETILGTGRTHLIFVLRSFFLLLGIEALARHLIGASIGDLGYTYPLIAYMGLVIAIILIDHKAQISDKRRYFQMGVVEIMAVIGILALSHHCAQWVKPMIALPQIFFAMIIAAGLGACCYRWRYGPTIRALLFAGLPVVLAANFMIGGSRISEAFTISGMNAVLAYGFFGQMFWMFGGIALLMILGKTNHARNLAPGMAGSLSHSGLTGACTAGDMGGIAARRAPIMINVPFFGHIFVFSILAMSATQGYLSLWPTLILLACGMLLTLWSLKRMAHSYGDDSREVAALMQFSFGWQITALFGGFLLLHLGGMPLNFAAMAVSSGLSHFGLFAATQGGMFGDQAALLIPFIFSMPFLIHPLVFFLFGKAMERDGHMPYIPVVIIASIGFLGILWAAFLTT